MCCYNRPLRALPCVVDLVDVDSRKWLDYSDAKKGLKSMLYKSEGRRLQTFEKRLTKHARAVLLVSEHRRSDSRASLAVGVAEACSRK